jgi:hypothetical protein
MGGQHRKGGCLQYIVATLGILALMPFAGAFYALTTR